MKFVLFVTILFEVAIHFTSASCSSSEFKCTNGTCISISVVCDAFPDCIDESDEKNCTGTTICSEDQKKCFHSYENFTCTNSATPCDCGSPGNIMYGTATLDDLTNSSTGATASVTCDDGYQALTPSLACLPSGLWTNSSCTAKDCGQLPPISAGSITLIDPKNTTYGASATVTCFTGYQANVTSVTCLASGLWESASCIIIDCGQLPPISAGSTTLDDPKNTTYRASATVTCFIGYQANVTSISCLVTGLWESASCTIIDCGQLPSISAGSTTLVDPKNSTYGASATVTCFTGYQANVTSVTCLASGLWESASCTIIDCGQLPPISSGSVTLADPKNTTYGASASVTCFIGYQANATSVSCLASGLWESASCIIIDCGLLPPISEGSIALVDPKNTTYGASATVTCFSGYQTNVTSVSCLASGMWESARCTVIDSIIPVETKEDDKTTITIIVALVFGIPCVAQLIVANFLHIKLSKFTESGASKGITAVLKIFPCGIPYIGVVFIIKFYRKQYEIYKVAKKQASLENKNRTHGTYAEHFSGNNRYSANTGYSNAHYDAVKLNGKYSCTTGDESNSGDKTVEYDWKIADQSQYDSVKHTDIELEHHPAKHLDDKRG